MEYQPKPNSGTLFANKTKQKPNSPDYSGTVLIDMNSIPAGDGLVTLRIAGWKKQGKSGSTFLSLALSLPQEQQSRSEASPASTSLADMEDDVPF
ncbi:MAG: hypothetical protein AMK69_20275 [Nitrospira bacterium SG8_3]|nr:MAG: hypothetical protein AMK69_20275 [Nitrospira bacterium SG8_3]